MRRSVLALASVLAFGTIGFMVIEGWPLERALFFTLISVTTVGYEDYGISQASELFTMLLLVCGIGVMSYSFGQLVQSAVEFQLNPERKTMRQINELSDHFIVCGLGRMGYAACVRLEWEGASFVAIDQNEKLVAQVLERGWLAIVGDASEDSTLERAGITRCRGVVCAASSDTDNIVITLSAHELRPDAVIISRAEHDDAARKIRRAGASHVVSPTRTAGKRIAEAILSPELASFLDDVHDPESGVGFAQVDVKPGAPLVGQTVRELGERHGDAVLVAFSRAGEKRRLRLPGDLMFEAGDVIIVAGPPETLEQMKRAGGGAKVAA